MHGVDDSRARPLRVAEVVSRLSVGGSVAQAITLTHELAARGHAATLLHGPPGPGEGTMAPLAERLGVETVEIAAFRRAPGIDDARAVLATCRALRALRPDVVHTHGAKAGAVGRVAARLAGVPVVVHTYHGHVLTGYFGRAASLAFRVVERALAGLTSRLVAVSEEVRADLVELGVAALEDIDVIPVGFDMAALALDGTARAAARAAARSELGIAPDAQVVALVGRLVPVKRAERFLAAAVELAGRPRATFLVIGDGECGPALRASAEADALGARLRFAGYRDDVARLYHAADVVCLTSDREGTPVSLIEAAACSLPVVATDVGSVRQVVVDGQTGHVVAPGDDAALTAAIADLLDDPAKAAALGRTGRERVLSTYGAATLAARHEALYRALAPRRSVRRRRGATAAAQGGGG